MNMNDIRYGSGRIMARRRRRSGYRVTYGYGGIPKRLFDLTAAVLLLVLGAPLMLFAAVAVMLEGGGIIFRQTRMGAGMKTFVCYKFRTMRRDAPPNCATSALERPERYITRTGAVLRRLSIDELPQLINVIRGDMSLVGPRPVIPDEKELIELRRSLGVYGVRPGITGLAQLRGRDCLADRRKAAYDAQYIERMSFGYDIRLLVGTLVSVAGCCGIREGKAEREGAVSGD